MSEPAPKSAHLILAESAERLFKIMASEVPMEESIDDAMGQLELAVRNYRAAERIAEVTPFGSLIESAINALADGNTEGAMKCLRVLRLATDYTPVVDVAAVKGPADAA